MLVNVIQSVMLRTVTGIEQRKCHDEKDKEEAGMKLKNCKNCGKMIGDTPSGFCDRCKYMSNFYTDFDKVRDYLYDFPGARITVVSKQTGVSISAIVRYVREGRMQEVAGMNQESGFCACGNPLMPGGKNCSRCKDGVKKEMERAKEDMKRV